MKQQWETGPGGRFHLHEDHDCVLERSPDPSRSNGICSCLKNIVVSGAHGARAHPATVLRPLPKSRHCHGGGVLYLFICLSRNDFKSNWK